MTSKVEGDDPTEPTEGGGEATPTEEGGSDPSAEGRDDPSEADAEDERPEIEADERAEIDLSGVDLEAVDGDDQDEDDADEDEDDAGDDGDEEATDVALSPSEGQSWGDMYVDVLAVILIAIVDEYGEGDRELTAEDIEELANQPPIALNEQANRCMEQMGGTRDLPPGQALVVGSSVVGATVLLRETDVAGDVVGELAGGLRGESA
jgi:hypothetical protein